MGYVFEWQQVFRELSLLMNNYDCLGSGIKRSDVEYEQEMNAHA